MTGTTWVEESGFLEGPLLITNTHSVGVVRDAAIAWRVKHGKADASGYWWSLPVVRRDVGRILNDINGFHVKPEHVFSALSSAAAGRVAEGNVGGGTGDDLLRVQGWHRHELAAALLQARRLHRRSARPMQLRAACRN
jgi:D-aminopeptidase